MAKAPRRQPARLLFQHSPNVIEKFGPEDLHSSYYPLPGIDFHTNPQLAQWVEKYGVAPDVLFRQGMAAPPLGKNESGLRHYTAEFTGDPTRVLNLDSPIVSQQPRVRDVLEKMGVSQRVDAPGYRDDTAEAFWLDALRQHGGFNNTRLSELDELVDPSLEGPNNLQNIAEWVASGDPGADAIRNELAPIVLSRMTQAGIPAASRMGPGWGAGTGYGPTASGKSPLKLLEDEAAAARAEGDIARAQELENQLAVPDDPEEAKQFFRDNLIPAPTEGTREYKVFDPNAVNIRRVASILGLMGVGGAAASAAEPEAPRYGDEGSAFSTGKWRPKPYSQEDLMGPQSFPYLNSRPEDRTLLQKGYDRLVAEDLRDDDMAEFQRNLPADHAKFMENLDKAMQMKVVHIGDDIITPDQYLNYIAEWYADMGHTSPTAINNVKRTLAGLPPLLSSDPMLANHEKELVKNLTDSLLEQMRETLPDGKASYGYERGATPEQLEEFRKKDTSTLGTEARWMLTPEGEQSFQAERVLNLFSTFQNGVNRPIYADMGSRIFGALGAPFDGAFGSVTGDTARLAASRGNTPSGRMAEALYWWDQGEPDGTAMNSWTGAKYPSISSTTMQGVTTKLDSPDHAIPRYNQQNWEQLLYNLDLSGRDFADLQALRDDQLRAVTPHIPAGADRVELRKLRNDLRDFQSRNSRGWANAYAPLWTKYLPDFAGVVPVEPLPTEATDEPGDNSWTNAWAGRDPKRERQWAAMTPEQQKQYSDDYYGKRATFLSPAGESLANLGRDLVDTQTVATLGAGSVMPVMRKGIYAVPRIAGDFAIETGKDLLYQEIPISTAFAAVNSQNQGHSGGMFAPQERSLVTYIDGPQKGQPVPAGDPDYARHLEGAKATRQNTLRDILNRGTNMYGRPLSSPPTPTNLGNFDPVGP